MLTISQFSFLNTKLNATEVQNIKFCILPSIKEFPLHSILHMLILTGSFVEICKIKCALCI